MTTKTGLNAEALKIYNAYEADCKKISSEYLKSEHATELKSIINQISEDWTIDHIVVVGIGYRPKITQLCMLLYLRRLFLQHLQENNLGATVKIFS
jgi:hypothetical protein